ncbi:hypothetical protein CFIMG_007839RA00001 [Ceratocystis fimbriata CBS 114723]|uniref:Uncharacterized protein n=1 Tax=Ceratocystis fimbriata CBS 114723 TaxID=1035309 RepID=A0A2C5W0Y8_9PEZI|nr:hypothetical protein CFIMG_007839RA00001 [Ceratocystis fimbriata CBS 114723]
MSERPPTHRSAQASGDRPAQAMQTDVLPRFLVPIHTSCGPAVLRFHGSQVVTHPVQPQPRPTSRTKLEPG